MSCFSGIMQVIFFQGIAFCPFKPLLILIIFADNKVLKIYKRQSVFCMEAI